MLVGASAVLVACGGALPGSPELLTTESPEEVFGNEEGCPGFGQVREPDLMAWSPSARANLKSLHEQGVVAVRYEADGCQVSLRVLDCVGEDQYAFSPYAARQSKVAETERELRAELPLGGASLGGEVGDGRALRTDYTLVGVKRIAVQRAYDSARLRGKCEDATHVISKIFVGGFGMAAGRSDVIAAGASAFGVGGELKQARNARRLVQEGDENACEKAQRSGEEEPRCSVPLRVGLTPIAGRAEGGCPQGTRWDSEQCVRDRPLQERCPPGTELRQGRCVPPLDTSCPPGMAFERGRGCRPVTVPVTTPTASAPPDIEAPAPTADGPCDATMVYLPSAEVTVGRDDGPSSEGPVHLVRIEGFCIDRTEVTARDYEQCLQRGECTRPERTGMLPEDRTDECTLRHAQSERVPATCVSYRQAQTYCESQGKRLPTEFEWEYAAAGTERRLYPWGNEAPGPLVTNGCGAECRPKLALHGVDDRFARVAPTASFPAGATPEGLLDMAGNVAEWTSSPWCFYPKRNCNPGLRVVRGGHYRSHLAASFRTTARRPMALRPHNPYVGFRCARPGRPGEP